MSKIITNNAQLQCTLGAAPAHLVVTSQRFVKIANELVATEQDSEGMVNILTFGTCASGFPQPPCVPSVQAWQQTTKKESINGNKQLTEDSFCMCAKGGRISFTSTGRNNFVDGE